MAAVVFGAQVRARIDEFFSRTVEQEFLQQNGGDGGGGGDATLKLLSLEPDSPVDVALRALETHNVLSAPVIARRSDDAAATEGDAGECLGMFDCTDVAAWLAREENAARTSFDGVTVRSLVNASRTDAFEPLSWNSPVRALASLLSTSHRVVVNDARGTLVAVVSQTDFLSHFLRAVGSLPSSESRHVADEHFYLFTPLGKHLRLAELPRDALVVSATQHETLRTAVARIAAARVSAVAVVDSESGALLGNFSASQLRRLGAALVDDNAKQLPALLDEQLGSSALVDLRTAWPVQASASDRLVDAIERLVSEHVHRLWLLPSGDASSLQPQALLSCSDAVRLIVWGQREVKE